MQRFPQKRAVTPMPPPGPSGRPPNTCGGAAVGARRALRLARERQARQGSPAGSSMRNLLVEVPVSREGGFRLTRRVRGG